MSRNDHASEAPFDLCIVGVGIAGLNALVVAGRLLPTGSRIAIVDRQPRVGGMWITTYPYVRLHQPHGQFTAGHLTWTLGAPRDHRASREEVLAHLDYCLAEVRKRHEVVEHFDCEYLDADESADGVVVRIRGRDGTAVPLQATRLITAPGFNITPNDPLALSSQRVRSVSPDHCDMRTGEIAEDQAPVWVIGGGKTAMDTAHALLTAHPGREVRLVVGSGSSFFNRDRLMPTGARRWTCMRATVLMERLAKRYDGTNEREVHRWFHERIGLALMPEPGGFLFGYLSREENETIRSGAADVIQDHLVDVRDTGDGVELVLRSGRVVAAAAGAWVVNCTGYFNHDAPPTTERLLSPGGRILSISSRTMLLHLTSYDGYFKTYAFLLDKLSGQPFFALDWEALRASSKQPMIYVLSALFMYNFSVLFRVLPPAAFTDFAQNADRHYPPPRQLIGVVRLFLASRRQARKNLASLQTVTRRQGVRGELLSG